MESSDTSGFVLISVIMPTFNAIETVERAMLSVQAQTYRHWELWIVDDGSSDCTAQYVADCAQQDSRINLIRLSSNSGSPATPRNEALTRARGSYIAFLDADDAWATHKLERQLALMQQSKAALSCTGAVVVRDQGQACDVRVPPRQATYASLLKQNTLICSSVMVEGAALGKRLFPVMGHEDYALWLEFAREGHSILGIADSLTFYHISANSISANKLKVLPYFWRIYREREGFSRVRTLLLTLRYAWLARKRAIKHIRA
ncbi:glycosyltransferase [uncultured Gilvimarinus sp.]|uniref:glycosyltransferase family 2 protein n=1 Tax=uncultured Gilvimarinus sp. TaxID=1689143 RepID=UPI0030D90B31